MKLLAVGVVLVQLSLAIVQADIPGTPINTTLLALQPASMSSEICNGYGYYTKCGGEPCGMVFVCLGEMTESRYCEVETPSKPYCNKGECSDVPVFDSICMPRQRTCTGSGYFPDPVTCSIYHYCESAHGISDVWQCKEGYVFNPETSLCKPRTSDADCMKVECDINQILTPYGTSKKYYGFCRYSGMHYFDINMYRCREGTEFTGKTCQFKCTAEGRFPDRVDKAVYYECVLEADGSYSVTPNVCPIGKIFDATKLGCITAPPSPA